MFRAAHNLKGLAASLGFDNIRDLTHRMETLFDGVRTGKHDLNARTIQVLFEVFDTLKRLVHELTQPAQVPTPITGALAALDEILTPVAGEATEPAQAAEVSDAIGTTAERDIDSGSAGNAIEEDPETMQLFVTTTGETLEHLTHALISLEETPDSSELVNAAFRAAHNIKAATGAVGLEDLFRLTHNLETVLDRVRSKNLDLDDEIMNAVFKAVDCLKCGVKQVSEGRTPVEDSDALAGLFEKWTRPDSPKLAVASVTNDDGDKGVTDSVGAGDGHCVVTVIFPENHQDASIQAYLTSNKLKDLADVIQTTPDINALDAESSIERIRYDIEPHVTLEEIKEAVSKYTKGEILLSDGAVEESLATSPASSATSIPGSSTPPATSPPALATAGRDSPIEPAIPAEPTASKSSSASSAGKPVVGAPRCPSTAGAPPTAKPVETLRVDLERLDQLMNLGGELVINRARLYQIRSRFDHLFEQGNVHYLIEEATDRINRLQQQVGHPSLAGGDSHVVADLASHVAVLAQDFASIRELVEQVHTCRPVMNDFAEALHSLSLVSDGIQRRIMETRRVAIGPLFQRYRRVVRDISKSTGKHVELVLHGESTELDKRMIDELGDPLTHMIRNSVDHGIESPEDRVRAGKPRAATVALNAYHRGRHICIEVKDDGRGVNIESVKRKILEKQLATPADLERMSEKELVQYIFKPGFSTAEKVTDLSGRGMGMDIVITKLDALNGTVDVESVTGVGTTVTIRLPLTLAIITAILARVGDGVCAIPLDSVAEIITVSRDSIQQVARRRVIRVRDRVIRVAFFEDIFSANAPGLQTRSKSDSHFTLVILSLQNEQIGLVVDDLIGQEDVVIKSIADNFRNIPGISGASIMGDGSVSLIMDVPSIFEMLAGRRDPDPGTPASGAVASTASPGAPEEKVILAN